MLPPAARSLPYINHQLINKKNVRSQVEVTITAMVYWSERWNPPLSLTSSPCYFRGLDNLIATARSNRVAVALASKTSTSWNETMVKMKPRWKSTRTQHLGNIFSGQVVGDTAEWMSRRFNQDPPKADLCIQWASGTSTVSSQLDTLIPASR